MNWKKGRGRLVKALPVFLSAPPFAALWLWAAQTKLSLFTAALLSLSVVIVPAAFALALAWVVLGFAGNGRR